MTSPQTIHHAASKGFQIAGDSYDRGRPEYPADAVELLVRVLGLKDCHTVVDLGAGTGKLTKLLVPSNARIIAVEPVEGMRRKFSSLLPEIKILDGTAESIPLPDTCADSVVVAQAFHWFNGERALNEIHRILKPGGKLGLIWNARDESVDWVTRLTEIIDPHEGDAPRYRSGKWRQAFESSTLFSPLQTEVFRHIHRGTHETVVDRIQSISFISALPEKLKQYVLNEVRSLLSEHPIASGKSEIAFPYRTDVFWCAKGRESKHA